MLFIIALGLISFALNSFFLSDTKKIDKLTQNVGVSDVFSNLQAALTFLWNSPTAVAVGLTEAGTNILLKLFVFYWSPLLKQYNEEFVPSNVFSFFMFSMMLGGSFFKFLFGNWQNSANIAKLGGFMLFLGLVVINLAASFEVAFGGMILVEISIGNFYPCYNLLRSEYYDKELNGTISSLFQGIVNFGMIVGLFVQNDAGDLNSTVFYSAIGALITFLIQMSCIKRNKVKYD